MIGLAQAVAKKQAPVDTLLPNQRVLDQEAGRKFDSTPENKDGRKFLYGGAVQIYDQGKIQRR